MTLQKSVSGMMMPSMLQTMLTRNKVKITMRMPAVTNSQPERIWVLFQTSSEARVQGERTPKKKFRGRRGR